MRILEEVVESYLHDLRPERSPVMREMEELAERDGIPIVHWETGRLLAVLCRALDPVVLEVGTAIGYSTLHMAEQLDARSRDHARARPRAGRAGARLSSSAAAWRTGWRRGGRRARDDRAASRARSTCCSWTRARASTPRYIELAEPKLSERALMVVDNLLMSGEVALPEDAETQWNADSLASARALNSELLRSDDWLACVLPVGDGIGVAARR